MNKRSRIALWHGLILFSLLVLAASPSKGANFVWTNTAGGAWVVPSNWSPNQVPGPTDNAFITNNGTYMVTLSSNATAVAGLTIGGGSGVQTLSAGTPTFTINAILTLSGSGTLAGSGAVTVIGTLNWMGGTMSGSGTTIIANGGTLSLNDATHTLSRVLQNDGTATWTAGALAMNGGTFNNNGSFTGSSATGKNCYGNGGVNAFNNAGTLTKQGAGLMRFYLNVNTGVSFNNSGTVDVQQGSLSFVTGGTNSGSILLAAGTTLDLPANYSHAGTSSISGPGTLNLTGGTQTFAAGAQVSAGLLNVTNSTVSFAGDLSLTNVAFSGGTLTGLGDVTITGTLNWSGGTMSGGGKTIIANGSTLSLNTTTHTLSRVLQNDGAATWTAGALAMNGGTFNNNGSFTGNTATGLNCYGNGGANAFNNAGTLTKQGAGQMEFYLNVNTGVSFNNSGTVDVQQGSLSFVTGGTNSGSILLAAGTTLDLPASYNHAATSSISGPGTLNLTGGTQTFAAGAQISAGLLNVTNSTVSFAGDLSLTNVAFSGGTLTGLGDVTITGTLNWSGGTMSGSGKTIIANGSTLSLNTTTHTLSRVLQNDGAATWTAGALAMNGGTFNNNGSFTGNTATGLNCYGNGGANTFNNASAFTKQGAGQMEFYLNTSTGVSFNNTGTVDVQQGSLSFVTGGTNSGSILLAAGTTLDLPASYNHAATSSISGPGTLNVTGGTQTFAAGAQISAGLLNVTNSTVSFMGDLSLANVAFSGGTLTGLGDVTITGTLNWSGGTMSGSGKTIVANGSTLSLNTTTHTLSRVLQNDGAATWTAGALAMNGGTFNNNGSFTGNSATGLNCYGNGGANTFNNASAFTKQGAGQMEFYLNTSTGVSFNNTGTVDVQQGSLSFVTGGTNSGSILLAAGTTLDLPASYNHAATSSISGPGTLNVTGGTQTFAAGAQVNAGLLNLSSGTVNFNSSATFSGGALSGGALAGSGDVTITGAFNWSGGTMSGTGKTIIAVPGTLNLVGGTLFLNRVLQNDGTATWTGGQWRMTGGTFNNNGSFTADSSSTLQCSGLGGVNVFNNAGILIKQGTGLTTFTISTVGVAFNNSGTVDVQSGTLGLDTGGLQSNDFTVAGGATLRLNGTHTFGAGADITGAGSLNVNGGTLTDAGAVNLTGALLIGGTATFNGPFTGGGSLAINGNGTVNFNTAATFSGGTLSGGTVAGSGDVTLTGALDWSGGTMGGAGKTIVANAGTLNLVGGTMILNRMLQNDGTVIWTGGVFQMNGGTFNNNDSFTVSNSVTLSCSGLGGVNVFNNAGSFIKQGTGLARFTITTVGVAFNNSGTMSVLSGVVAFSGGFVPTSTSVLDIAIGGPAVGTQHGQVQVTGAAPLAGSLNVQLVNGFLPGQSNTFTVMTYGSHTGTFAALTGDGPVFQPQYDPLALVLTAKASLAACATVPAGLVSWWPMNGNVSDLADSNSPSATNALSFIAGRVGQGVRLGTGGFIEIPQSTNLAIQAFTIDAWVRPDGPGPNNDAAGSVIFQKNINVPNGIQSSVELVWRAVDNRFLFEVYGVGVLSSQACPPGQFYHVAGTHDGTTLRLYVNGVLSAEQARSGAIVYDASVPYTIGANFSGFRANGFPRTWNGVIDEVHFFNRALTSNEIGAIHTADDAGLCPPPTITAQPASATVPVGGNHTFTVVAAGSGPFTYQWRKNGVDLPGETSATFTINNAQAADVGLYSVQVSGTGGTVTSVPAELAMLDSYSLDLPAGFSLIANQLYQSNDLVSTVFPNVPNGTTVYKWNGAIQSFLVETFIAGLGWQPGTTTLAPGEGAFINLPSPQTLVFTGAFRPPTLPINLVAGYNLVSRQIPRPGNFEQITGRSPIGGAVVDQYRPAMGDYRTSVFLDGQWRDRVPVAQVGEAVWVSQVTRPVITGQPSPQMNATPGSTINFAVEVTGTPPLRFQWQRNGVSIPDATNASYTIANAQISDSGIYTVAVQAGRITPPTPQPGEPEDLPGVLMSASAPLRFITTDFPFSDDFGARPVVSTLAATLTGNNSAASREPGEPRHAGKPGRRSVWLAWMAPTTGIVTFITLGSSFDTLLAAYSGPGFPGVEVASDDDGVPFLGSRITFNATAGQIYNIAVDGFGRGSGDFILGWILEATTERVPVILTQPQNQVASLNGAAQFTVEAAGPNLTYQWFLDGQAVSGATSSNLVINPVRADDVGVYVVRVNSGSRFILSHLAQLQIGAVQTLPLVGSPKEGEDELLAVDKFQDIVFAATNNALVTLPGKAIHKVVAHGFSGTQIFSSVGSTKEADEPSHCGVRGGKSEWFSYQPTNSGALLVDTDGSNFDTVLAIYVGPGDDFLTLTNVACDNNSGTNGRTSSVFFNVTSNTIYYIAIDGVNNPVTGVAYSGRIQLNYRLVRPIVLTSLTHSPSNNGRIIFNVTGTPNVAATVQSASSLSSPDWISLFTNTTANGSFNYTNTNAMTFTNRFYRAVNEF